MPGRKRNSMSEFIPCSYWPVAYLPCIPLLYGWFINALQKEGCRLAPLCLDLCDRLHGIEINGMGISWTGPCNGDAGSHLI